MAFYSAGSAWSQDSSTWPFHGPPPAQLRLPTVTEALYYTPFSSIIPFDPDVVGIPLSSLANNPVTFAGVPAVQSTRKDLERLVTGAQSAEHASHRCQRTMRDVQKLLDRDGSTQYEFKRRHKTKRSVMSRVSDTHPILSTFAGLVLQNFSSSRRVFHEKSATSQHNVPDRHDTDSMRHAPIKPLQVAIPVRTIPSPDREYQDSPKYLDRDAVHLEAYVRPAPVTPAQRAEYVRRLEHTDDNTKDHDPVKPSAHPSSNLGTGFASVSVDHRRKADAAVDVLYGLLESIFLAEDQIQPDTSEFVSLKATPLVTTRGTNSGNVTVLCSEAQSKLDSAVHRAVAYGRLGSIEIDHLVRVQKLCENAVTALATSSLVISEDWSDDESHEWAIQVTSAADSLVAARTMVRILTATSHLKELQSEEHLRGVLDAIRIVVETCIIPVVEERAVVGEKSKASKDSSLNRKFAIAAEHKRQLQNLIRIATKCLVSLGDLFSKAEIDESGISSLEYLSTALIFAENAPSERDAAVGIQTFEDMRRTAMDLLARTFSKYTNQRQFIFDEILMSLEKLPSTKQNARQFRLNDGRPIQLVSALLMRLVQASAASNVIGHGDSDHISSTPRNPSKAGADDNAGDGSNDDDDDDGASESEDELAAANWTGKGLQSSAKSKHRDETGLDNLVKPLTEGVRKNANYIVKLLLQRALSTSKSSEEPFRKLLDIFVEDFLSVLTSSDWPAAEILLRSLVISAVRIVENSKSPAPARALALELLGVIGSGIVDVHVAVQDAVKAVDPDDSLSKTIANAVYHVDGATPALDLVAASGGPYHVVIQYLYAREVSDAQLQTARSYHLLQWAETVLGSSDLHSFTNTSGRPSNSLTIKRDIRAMMEDAQWLENSSQLDTPSTAQGKLAARVIASNSLLCKAFPRIFSVLLASMSSEQSTIRSRSLKSVMMLLEKDPSILDRNAQVMTQILRSLRDPSSLVRDSALTLIEKCVSLRSSLDLTVYEQVVSRITDTAVSVRKRSMRLLEKIYLQNSDLEVRCAIANAIMSRVSDSDPGVSEAARSTMEEIWFSVLHDASQANERTIDQTVRYRSQVSLIIRTIDASESAASIMIPLVRSLLTTSKQCVHNQKVCKTIVGILFDGIIDSTDIPGLPSQSSSLRALTVFARAQPRLFIGSQLELLEPYVQNLTNSDDLDVYHFAIIILRHTMPCLPGINADFLLRLQTSLLTSVGKIPRSELTVVAPCLWSIDHVLGNTDRLVRFMISALSGLYPMRGENLRDNLPKQSKTTKLLTIVGQFGNACNFDKHFQTFKQTFGWYKGLSVSGLWIEIICNFTLPSQVLSVREAALSAICAICQGYPQQFLREDVTNAFELALKDRHHDLEVVLLSSLEVFFTAQESTARDVDGADLGTGVASGTQRLGGTYVATNQDSASASLSQRFLADFLRIALSSMDETALAAARIIVSINRQGMAHPRESGPCLVALETCPNSTIANMAFLEHKAQYAKHESVFEKESMRAVQQSFDYQHTVVNSIEGYAGTPITSKLHFFWDVLKTGKAKVRAKFFVALCHKLDFDLNKLTLDGENCAHLSLVRYCSEAIAFLEYDRADELADLLKLLERTVAGTGTLVAQAIESEVNNLQVAAEADVSTTSQSGTGNERSGLLPERLSVLAVAAQILKILWETRTFLRRNWNMHKYAVKTKGAAKDNVRAPSRATNASSLSESYLKRIETVMTKLSTPTQKRDMCLSFAELMAIDNEVNVDSDAGNDEEAEHDYDSASSGSATKSNTIGSKKRKPTVSASDVRKRVRQM